MFRILVLFIASFLGLNAFAQSPKQIEIVNANTFEYDESIGNRAKRLLGNVIFKQDNVLMYCDSAYFYSESNSLDAFSNVHIQQGDSIHAYGEFLKYDGNAKHAELRNNVKMLDKDMTLTTDILFYDTGKNIAWYIDGGKIVNKKNTLTSKHGYYYSNPKDLFFKYNVLLVNPKNTLTCDTLKYNTRSEKATILSPTKITGKDNYLYCEGGWYDTKHDKSEITTKALIIDKDKQISAEYIYYDGKLKFGKAKNNASITDTTKKITVKGNYIEFNDSTQISFATGNALFMQYDTKDTLFLHADTLKSTNDTLNKKRRIFAFYKVKFYRDDMQGKCDSMVYEITDSLIKLYNAPILWSDSNQILAKYIELQTAEGGFKSVFLEESAFIATQKDTLYNQIKGSSMRGYFKNGNLNMIHVLSDGESIYYPEDEKKKEIIGHNKTKCNEMKIYMKEDDSTVDKIMFYTNPEATLSPLKDVKLIDTKLETFEWFGKWRPYNRWQIFNWEN